MNLGAAQRLARSLMNEHGLTGWAFMFDRAKRRFGSCIHNPQTGNGILSLSKHLTALNDEGTIRDTILHEIAHALAGPGMGHGQTWKRLARSVGCSSTRCYGSDVVTPPKAWKGICDSCGQTIRRDLRKNIACGRCCRRLNGGRFDPRFRFRWERNDEALS